MKIEKVVLVSLILAFKLYGGESVASKTPELYLNERIPIEDQRYPTMAAILKLLDERNPKVIVETGTARYGDRNFIGDGGSTIIFSDWAEANNCLFYSVDISPEAILEAKKAIDSAKKNTTLVCEDSIKFLAEFLQPIDFLYLDSYDFDSANPQPSQEHHLKEIKAAYPHLAKNCVIMIDDCLLPHGGKGALVIPYLVSKGWVIYINAYQVILVRQ